jgi:hypothetical protein
MIAKITFAVNIACILVALIIAHEYHDAKAASASKLASAIAEARQAERSAAMSRSVQKAVLDDEIHYLMPHLPKTALDDYKQPAVMRVSVRKVKQ